MSQHYSRPSLFRLKDILTVWFGLFLGAVVLIMAVLSHLNPNTWGESVPAAGWFVVSLMNIGTIVIFVAFYYQRWKFINKWRYTVYGVQIYYEDGTQPYLRKEMMEETKEMLNNWFKYYKENMMVTDIIGGRYIEGSICIFRPERVFDQKKLGFTARLVYGISGWNWAVVGQGNRPLNETAYAHEMNHIHLNRVQGKIVSEQESHKIFKDIGA